MTKVDELIEKFKEFKEELNKGVNASYAPQPNMSMSKDSTKQYGKAQNATTGTSGGENSIYKNVVAPMNMSEAGPAGVDMMAMSEEVIKFEKNGQWSLNKSAFKTLQHKIEREGHSKDSAGAITASIGRKELGQKEMTARSKAGMNKVDPEENINIPHPQGKAKMANGVNKRDSVMDDDGANREANPRVKMHDVVQDRNMERDSKLGTNQRLANPPAKNCPDARGRVHMVKEEGTNERAGTSHPHNKGKFKVMDEVEEKTSEKASPKGKPYNDKGEVKKADEAKMKKPLEHEEQRAQNKARQGCFGI
jgi:hypothetical protein